MVWGAAALRLLQLVFIVIIGLGYFHSMPFVCTWVLRQCGAQVRGGFRPEVALRPLRWGAVLG